MILVDEPVRRKYIPLSPNAWCYLASDSSLSELHDFAKKLKMPRAWFRGGHYDLPEHFRSQAIALGARVVTTPELTRRMVGPRAAGAAL